MDLTERLAKLFDEYPRPWGVVALGNGEYKLLDRNGKRIFTDDTAVTTVRDIVNSFAIPNGHDIEEDEL